MLFGIVLYFLYNVFVNKIKTNKLLDKGRAVVQWLALSPHSKKVLGLNLSQDVSVWSLHVLHVSVWGTPVSSHIDLGVGQLV